ncbi:glycosyltransferase family 4 protein [Candidatus Margulisiibacteriota bacterium]
MKVLFYTDTIAYGGAERFLKDIIRHMAGKKHEILLVCADPQVFLRIGSFNGFRIMGSPIKSFYDLKGFFGLLKIFRVFKPDVIHINFLSLYSCQYGAVAAKLTLPHDRIFGTVHTPAVPSSRFPLIGAIRKYIAKQGLLTVAKCICPSKASASLLASNYAIDKNRVITIYNGVAQKNVSESELEEMRDQYRLSGKRILVYVSRLVRKKGLEILINAFKEVSGVISDLRLMIIGDGYLMNELKDQADDLKIADNIIFTGYQMNIDKFLKVAEVAVVPSLDESLPYSISEAMVYGKPIIATRVGGTPEQMGDDAGLLIPPGDIKALSSAIINIVSDKELAGRLGNNARVRANKMFSMEKMLNEYENMLQESK